jgi:hypothetical protein
LSLKYKYNVYAVSPGHDKSRKAVLLRMDQHPVSKSFIDHMGTARRVTLIAVSKTDSFNEWATRTGYMACDCTKKACRAPVGSEFTDLQAERKVEAVVESTRPEATAIEPTESSTTNADSTDLAAEAIERDSTSAAHAAANFAAGFSTQDAAAAASETDELAASAEEMTAALVAEVAEASAAATAAEEAAVAAKTAAVGAGTTEAEGAAEKAAAEAENVAAEEEKAAVEREAAESMAAEVAESEGATQGNASFPEGATQGNASFPEGATQGARRRLLLVDFVNNPAQDYCKVVVPVQDKDWR